MTLFRRRLLGACTRTGDDLYIAQKMQECKQNSRSHCIVVDRAMQAVHITQSSIYLYKNCKRLKNTSAPRSLHLIRLSFSTSHSTECPTYSFLFLFSFEHRYTVGAICVCTKEHALLHHHCDSVYLCYACVCVSRVARRSMLVAVFDYLHFCWFHYTYTTTTVGETTRGREKESESWFVLMCVVVVQRHLQPVRLFLETSCALFVYWKRNNKYCRKTYSDWDSRHKFNNNLSISISFGLFHCTYCSIAYFPIYLRTCMLRIQHRHNRETEYCSELYKFVLRKETNAARHFLGMEMNVLRRNSPTICLQRNRITYSNTVTHTRQTMLGARWVTRPLSYNIFLLEDLNL